VTVVDSDGLGGACVLTDCVPSKTLIATSETMVQLRGSDSLGIEIPGASGTGNGDPGSSGRGGGAGTRQAAPGERDWINAPRLYGRVKALAQAQSADVGARLAAEGVEVVVGRGRLTRLTRPARLAGAHAVVVGDREIVAAPVRPR
jgi:dihydrolipoamide dehydrogenase